MPVLLSTQQGKILSRRKGRVDHEREYRVFLDDATTTLVRERHEHDRNINDRYIINVYDDVNFNTFGQRL